ncbi:MAG: sigma 54-interacting transcriptional regulator [bacterium]
MSVAPSRAPCGGVTGAFKAASGGTLFLDEVAEIPLPAQAKLLRVLQEGVVEPIGTNTPTQVDVRIISATHRDLKECVNRGTFREDLYYRLNVLDIVAPPLRERTGDLPLLVEDFPTRFSRAIRSTFARDLPEAWATLMDYRFPATCASWSTRCSNAESCRSVAARSAPSTCPATSWGAASRWGFR